jgi:hypothetical protein
MHPYWIDINGNTGVGITARSDEDALAIFHAVFGERYTAAGIRVISDMNELEQGHVVPNMTANWFKRGVWFPLGYEEISN